jgi:Holliday junction resolvase RusA-like endonuclease
VVILRLEHPGEPMPSPRPRVVNGRTFMPARYVAYRDGLAWAMRAQLRRRWLTGPMALEVAYVRGTLRVCDLDNLLKTTMDAGTAAGIWADDVQVAEIHATKRYEKGAGRLELVVRRVETAVARDSRR